jgi:ABC-type dipeptide/oligopeptide/nickel transport system permease subunit
MCGKNSTFFLNVKCPYLCLSQTPAIRMFFRKKEYVSSSSLSALAWKKFRKDRLGFGSLIFIIFVFLVAIFGYLVVPDPTPYANDQHLELGLKKPGYHAELLLVPKPSGSGHTGFLRRIVSGAPARYSSYPVVEGMVDVPGREGIAETVPAGQALHDFAGARVVSRTFWLGTDRFGRDVLSQLVIGSRVSLSVGFISVFISLVIGIFIGALGGYYRGRVDAFVVWFINVVWSVPTLLLVIAITFALGKGFWQVFVAVGLTMWVEVARVVRGQVLSIREKEFVEAGRALGFSDARIIFHHILPNIMGIVIVISAANFASAILLEAGLSFLGMGVQPPVPSWGSMIKENYGYIVLDYAYLAILPGIAIMLLVLAFMLTGNALRDALDVRTSTF